MHKSPKRAAIAVGLARVHFSRVAATQQSERPNGLDLRREFLFTYAPRVSCAQLNSSLPKLNGYITRIVGNGTLTLAQQEGALDSTQWLATICGNIVVIPRRTCVSWRHEQYLVPFRWTWQGGVCRESRREQRGSSALGFSGIRMSGVRRRVPDTSGQCFILTMWKVLWFDATRPAVRVRLKHISRSRLDSRFWKWTWSQLREVLSA